MIEIQFAQYEYGSHDMGTIMEAVEETQDQATPMKTDSESGMGKAGRPSRVSGRWE